VLESESQRIRRLVDRSGLVRAVELSWRFGRTLRLVDRSEVELVELSWRSGRTLRLVDRSGLVRTVELS